MDPMAVGSSCGLVSKSVTQWDLRFRDGVLSEPGERGVATQTRVIAQRWRLHRLEKCFLLEITTLEDRLEQSWRKREA